MFTHSKGDKGEWQDPLPPNSPAEIFRSAVNTILALRPEIALQSQFEKTDQFLSITLNREDPRQEKCSVKISLPLNEETLSGGDNSLESDETIRNKFIPHALTMISGATLLRDLLPNGTRVAINAETGSGKVEGGGINILELEASFASIGVPLDTLITDERVGGLVEANFTLPYEDKLIFNLARTIADRGEIRENAAQQASEFPSVLQASIEQLATEMMKDDWKSKADPYLAILRDKALPTLSLATENHTFLPKPSVIPLVEPQTIAFNLNSYSDSAAIIIWDIETKTAFFIPEDISLFHWTPPNLSRFEKLCAGNFPNHAKIFLFLSTMDPGDKLADKVVAAANVGDQKDFAPDLEPSSDTWVGKQEIVRLAFLNWIQEHVTPHLSKFSIEEWRCQGHEPSLVQCHFNQVTGARVMEIEATT